jgi:hypothetical protein
LLEQRLRAEVERRTEILRLEQSLTEFVKAAWPYVDTSDYQDSWAIEALCEHLEAVTRGDIKRLLINFPPRCGKTKVASICWPAWVWARRQEAYLSGPKVQFFCGSYSGPLSLKISNETRRLINSPWYQERWGKRFTLMADQNAKNQFDNDKGGTRIASSVGGLLIGVGGSVILIDDPHNTEEVESEAERETVLRWWKEVSSTRLNDPKRSAIVVIMQRLHEEDVSGTILKDEDADEWTHLMIPMEHDPRRHCATVLKWDQRGQPATVWEDPRSGDGELMWPERFGPKEVKRLQVNLGPYMASGRLQQMPQPKGGGIFKPEWWNNYPTDSGKIPACHYVIASVDGAFTKDQENDPSALTVWGVWKTDKGHSKVILLSGWQKWLEMRGETVERLPEETDAAYVRRARPQWGLVENVAHECKRFRVDKLLIEAKASGHTLAQEMAKLHRNDEFPRSVELIDPKRQDKRARAIQVQHLFADGMVFAPGYADGAWRDWVNVVINETAKFRGIGDEEDNLVDSTTQALRYLRDTGWLIRGEERAQIERELGRHKGGPPQALYPS